MPFRGHQRNMDPLGHVRDQGTLKIVDITAAVESATKKAKTVISTYGRRGGGHCFFRLTRCILYRLPGEEQSGHIVLLCRIIGPIR